MTYTPDSWVIIKIAQKDKPALFKILAGWYGGFTQGDSWKMNSGVKTYHEKDGLVSFLGFSNSVYKCSVDSERFTGQTAGIYEHYKKEIGEKYPDTIFQHITYEQFKQEFKE